MGVYLYDFIYVSMYGYFILYGTLFDFIKASTHTHGFNEMQPYGFDNKFQAQPRVLEHNSKHLTKYP